MAGSKLGKRRRGAQAAPEAPPVALSSKVARGGGGFGSKAPRAKRARVEDHGDEDDGDASDGTAAAASSSCSPSSFSSSSGGAAALWSKVLVKVGVCGTWRKFEPDDDDDDVLDMDASDLLEELTDSKIFGGYFKRVEVLGDCKVYVRKGVLAAGQLVPAAAEEADDSKLVELDADMTVRDAAKKAKCKGKRLFIRVRLPGGAAAAPAGLESELIGAARRPSGICTVVCAPQYVIIVIMVALLLLLPHSCSSSQSQHVSGGCAGSHASPVAGVRCAPESDAHAPLQEVRSYASPPRSGHHRQGCSHAAWRDDPPRGRGLEGFASRRLHLAICARRYPRRSKRCVHGNGWCGAEVVCNRCRRHSCKRGCCVCVFAGCGIGSQRRSSHR